MSSQATSERRTFPTPTANRKAIFFLLFLPVLIIFDLAYYWYTRDACLQCGNFGEFIRTSSLSVYIIAQSVAVFRKRPPSHS